MDTKIVFRLGKLVREKSELVVGKYYHFYNEVYLYCGNIEPFANAHAFGCIAGTLYVNDATIRELIDNKELKCATRVKESTAEKALKTTE